MDTPRYVVNATAGFDFAVWAVIATRPPRVIAECDSEDDARLVAEALNRHVSEPAPCATPS